MLFQSYMYLFDLAALVLQIIANCSAETLMRNIMRGMGCNRNIPAGEFMFTLRSGFNDTKFPVDCKVDCLMVADLKMEIWVRSQRNQLRHRFAKTG